MQDNTRYGWTYNPAGLSPEDWNYVPGPLSSLNGYVVNTDELVGETTATPWGWSVNDSDGEDVEYGYAATLEAAQQATEEMIYRLYKGEVA